MCFDILTANLGIQKLVLYRATTFTNVLIILVHRKVRTQFAFLNSVSFGAVDWSSSKNCKIVDLMRNKAIL